MAFTQDLLRACEGAELQEWTNRDILEFPTKAPALRPTHPLFEGTPIEWDPTFPDEWEP